MICSFFLLMLWEFLLSLIFSYFPAICPSLGSPHQPFSLWILATWDLSSLFWATFQWFFPLSFWISLIRMLGIRNPGPLTSWLSPPVSKSLPWSALCGVSQADGLLFRCEFCTLSRRACSLFHLPCFSSCQHRWFLVWRRTARVLVLSLSVSKWLNPVPLFPNL